MNKIVIIGAGISGLSTSYHFGHKNCIIFEKDILWGGHAKSEKRQGIYWDQGPHVSFTNNEYVIALQNKSVDNEYLEIDSKISNYYKGNWIDHPAQSNLYQIPEPMKTECVEGFIQAANMVHKGKNRNYQEFLDRSFGRKFSRIFPTVYTKKYWSVSPEHLTTDWVKQRVYVPKEDEILKSANGYLGKNTNYIQKIRYPKHHGFQSFFTVIERNADIKYGIAVEKISLREKKIWLSTGEEVNYSKLVNTLPLPEFIHKCIESNDIVFNAAKKLAITQLILVNISTNKEHEKPFTWFYVYDEDKLTTRVSLYENISTENIRTGRTGIQCEYYFSRFRPLEMNLKKIISKMISELNEMCLIKSNDIPSGIQKHLVYVPNANIIFDHQRVAALNQIYHWLSGFGLKREEDDLDATTNWNSKKNMEYRDSNLIMAGRYGQWKYYWSDDCVLRGKYIASNI